MSPATVQDLMRDAHVLAQYAVRNGQLPANSKVFELLSALGASPNPAGESAMVAALYAEIDALSKAIAPVTFSQLAWRQSMFGQARRAVAVITPFTLGLLTLLLTIYLAFQSSQLHQADTALRAYQEWAGQQPREKLYAAFKMYRYERVLNVKQPPLAQLDAYQKLVEDAHQLASKGAAIQTLLQNASDFRYFPPFLQDGGWLTYSRLINTAGNAATTTQVELKPGIGTDPAVPGSGPGAGAQGLPRDCAMDPAPTPARGAQPTPFHPPSDMEAYASGWACFLQLIGIDQQRLSYSPWPVIYATQLKVNMLVTWLLPGLYGLLGACVYLMRDMMIVRNGGPMADGNVLNHLSLLLRIALGGLAGIIIGWFWVPTAIGNGAAAQPISSIPFGIAFLAGFSIETLFSMLDRLNKTIGDRDAKSREAQEVPAAKAMRHAAAG